VKISLGFQKDESPIFVCGLRSEPVYFKEPLSLVNKMTVARSANNHKRAKCSARGFLQDLGETCSRRGTDSYSLKSPSPASAFLI
jgi:hypothetical protein